MSQSLVKYDNPFVITESTPSSPSKKTANTKLAAVSTTTATVTAGGQTTASPEKKVPPILQTEDILNAILPQKQWEEDGKLWAQKVSSNPATRLDVVALQEQLDIMLQKRQARETGICPIRRELYDQCFDEIIRQVTIACQERGLLLLRIRDELRMTLSAYQTLYESSIAFGMRKSLSSEQGKFDLEEKSIAIEQSKKELMQKVAELQSKCDTIEKREAEKRANDDKKHMEEVSFLKKTNGQLKAQLESILNPKK